MPSFIWSSEINFELLIKENSDNFSIKFRKKNIIKDLIKFLINLSNLEFIKSEHYEVETIIKWEQDKRYFFSFRSSIWLQNRWRLFPKLQTYAKFDDCGHKD